MAELKVNLEQGNGLFYAHAADYLGCFAKAMTRSDAIDALLHDVKEYSEWILTKELNNEYKIKAKEFLSNINELKIIEEQSDIPELGEPKGTSALFETDKQELTEEQIEFFISIIKCLPDEIVRMVFQLSDEQRDKVILPEKPTINQELSLIYDIELYYIQRFGPEIEQKFLEAIKMTMDELDSLLILERVVKVQQGIIAVLRSCYPKLINTIFTNNQNTAYPDEQWTIKKLIRRFIEFQREYISSIKLLVDSLEKVTTPNEDK